MLFDVGNIVGAVILGHGSNGEGAGSPVKILFYIFLGVAAGGVWVRVFIGEGMLTFC